MLTKVSNFLPLTTNGSLLLAFLHNLNMEKSYMLLNTLNKTTFINKLG